MLRRIPAALVATGLLFSCEQGPPPGHVTQQRVKRDIDEARKFVDEGKLGEALAVLERAEKGLEKVARLTRKMGPVWRNAKKARARLDGLKKGIFESQEAAAREAAGKKRAEEEAAKYVARGEEKPKPKKEEKVDRYVDRDVEAGTRFAARERADEKPAAQDKPRPPAEKPAIPKDIKPEEPVTVVKLEAKGKHLLCYVVFANPGNTAYLASLSVDFLDKKGKTVTYNRMTYRFDGFKPNWSNIYESKGAGVAANELIVRERKKVNLVGVGDDPRANLVKKVRVTVTTADGHTYTGKGPK